MKRRNAERGRSRERRMRRSVECKYKQTVTKKGIEVSIEAQAVRATREGMLEERDLPCV